MTTSQVPLDQIPNSVSDRRLWWRLSSNPEYVSQILEIRKVADSLAQRVSATMPGYTDHSIRHMDALWGVADQILLEAEIQSMSSGEAFLLGAAFYLHDLGMASTVTKEGKEKIRTTEAYKAAFARYSRTLPADLPAADARALEDATRDLHASGAIDFATQKIPGLNRYLIEVSDFRTRWAHWLGQVAASHHWGMEDVESRLGIRGRVPGPDGETIDLAFVACALRIVDFAHINRERAPRLERLLRGSMSASSVVHWDAQANITGPIRDGDFLVYGCTEPIHSPDAWWLFYDLASQLNAEIRSVYDYMRNRTVSAARFSLKGVKGVERPDSFNELVRLDENLLPLDIRIQPRSMERVVDLLGGRQVYGEDELAPIRELIQNAYDAVKLRQAMESAEGRPITAGEIRVEAFRQGDSSVLEVIDNGVGMTRSTVLRHLVAVGSDFWNSTEFYSQYRLAADHGFRPIGRFGVGFLSVFMLGDLIEITTHTSGNNTIRLALNGLGKRGQMGESAPTTNSGTKIRIILRQDASPLMSNLKEIVQARAPMLDVPIVVKTGKGDGEDIRVIKPGWWKATSEGALLDFTKNWQFIARRGAHPSAAEAYETRYGPIGNGLRYQQYGGTYTIKGWPANKPEFCDDSNRIICMGGEAAAPVLLCSQGIAVGVVFSPDVAGLIEMGPADLTVSRESFTSESRRRSDHGSRLPLVQERILKSLRPAVISAVNGLSDFGMIPGRLEFIRGLASIFGSEVLLGTDLKWIPVTLPPGNLIHFSRSDFDQLLAQRDRLLLGCGVSSAGVYSVASAHIPTPDLAAIPLVAFRKEELETDYTHRNVLDREGREGLIRGPLTEILRITKQTGDDLILIRFLLSQVSKVWGLTAESLFSQNWVFNYKDSILIGDLRRASGAL